MNQNTPKISVHDAANRFIMLNRPLKLKARIKELLDTLLTDLRDKYIPSKPKIIYETIIIKQPTTNMVFNEVYYLKMEDCPYDESAIVYTIKHFTTKYSAIKGAYVSEKMCSQFLAPRHSLIYQNVYL